MATVVELFNSQYQHDASQKMMNQLRIIYLCDKQKENIEKNYCRSRRNLFHQYHFSLVCYRSLAGLQSAVKHLAEMNTILEAALHNWLVRHMTTALLHDADSHR